MDAQAYAKIRKKVRAIVVANNMNLDLVEDFTQDIAIEIWKNPKKNVSYLVVDQIRKMLGRKNRDGDYKRRGTAEAKLRRDLLNMTRDYDDTFMNNIPPEQIEKLNNKAMRHALSMKMKKVGQLHNAVLILRYKWEFGFKDIGEILGFTESRASQLHKKALELMKKGLTQHQSAELRSILPSARIEA